MHDQRLIAMIRAAQAADVPAIVELGARLHAESCYRDISFDKPKVARLMHSLIEGAGVVFVAERDGKILGGLAGGVTEHWFSTELVGFEYSFFIVPEARHGLIAAKIVTAMRLWCKAKGAKWLRMGITTDINADGTARFYRHLGFKDAGSLFELEL